MKRFDERDTIFARMNYKKGTKEYNDYYSRNPDKQAIDDELRSMPQIAGVGTSTYHPLHSPIADAGYRFLGDIKKYAEGPVNTKRTETDPTLMTVKLKKLSSYFGASLVGIAKMKDYHYYSHRGRESSVYGEEVDQLLPYGIVFAVEMDKDMINRAPQIEEMLAATKGYMDAAIIGMWLSYYLRELGYEARNHMDGNFLVITPLVAEEAGLGEIGRNGLLITKEFGPRVRLGVVTTTMPLKPDHKIDFGVKKFCDLCAKCAFTCPSKAIPAFGMENIDGIMRWKIDAEACHKVWRKMGTDCGICLSTCPYSQGIPEELLIQMQNSEEIMIQVKKEYGLRTYINEELDLFK